MGFFNTMLLFHLFVYVAILCNFQFFRSAIGFAYLLFIPGFIIMRLLKLDDLEIYEKILFSVGLSVAFLMFMGLFLDLIAPLAGFSGLLSTNLLVVSFSAVLLPLSSIGENNETFRIKVRDPRLLALVVVCVFLIVLGISGTLKFYSFENILLMFLILSVSLIVCVTSISEKLVPSHYYPLILIISCAVLLFFVSNDTAIVTNYLIGRGDQWIEFYAFRSTDIASRWIPTLAASSSSPGLFPTYSMLSVTILPTIFERITGLDNSWIFKLLYPSVVCLMALGTYALYRTQVEKKIAFLGTFFFIAVSVGKGWGSDKQLVAQLFFVALLLLIFRKGLPRVKKDLLFTIFSAGLVVSHYSLSYIFMFIILSAWLILAFVDYSATHSLSTSQSKLPFDLVLIYTTLAFSWYIYVNFAETFRILLQTTQNVAGNVGQFFNLQSRGTALTGLGLVEAPNLLGSISSFLFVFTEFLVVFGFLWIIIKEKKTSFAFEYKIIAALNVGIIAINLLLPTLADTFLMSRFYQTTLIVLAPLAIIGGKTILEHIPKVKTKSFFPILAIMIFIPFFMFQTGLIYEVAGVQNESLTLDVHRWDNLKLYDFIIDSQQVSGAVWISDHTNTSTITMFADYRATYSVLVSYGLIAKGQISVLSNETNVTPSARQFIFLRSVNTLNEKIVTADHVFNVSEISSVFENQDKIFSTGGCEIYSGYIP